MNKREVDRGPLHGVTSEMLWLMRRLVIAIAALVCVGAASPRSVTTVEVSTACCSMLSPLSCDTHQWRDGAPRSAIEEKSLDSDIDDDGDTRCDGVADGAVAIKRSPFPRKAPRALRAELSVDPSNFGVGPGLPRGPPA